MRISPLVILTSLALAACGQAPGSNVTDGGSETDTETGSGTDTSTTDASPTTGGGGVCTPGSSIGCVCPSAEMGLQACRADGSGYGACECEGGGSNSNSDGTTGPDPTTDGVTTTTTTTTETTTDTTTETTTETTTTTGTTGEDTTTGEPACEDPGPEPNDKEAEAIDLGEQGCNQAAETLEGVLEGDGDEDWFSYHGTWSALCVFGPQTAHTLTASDDVRLCVFADCDQGDASFNCPNGTTEADSPAGRPGCCGSGDVDFTLDCSLLNDNARIYIRVDQAPADACVDYSVQYKYDE